MKALAILLLLSVTTFCALKDVPAPSHSKPPPTEFPSLSKSEDRPQATSSSTFSGESSPRPSKISSGFVKGTIPQANSQEAPSTESSPTS